jgi:hypothetical protein
MEEAAMASRLCQPIACIAAYRVHTTIFALALSTVFECAQAASAYRIEAMYSTLDGTYQYVQLRDVRDAGQANPSDLTLIATNRYGVAKSIPLTNLPPYPTRGQGILLATAAMTEYWDVVNMGDYYSPELGAVLPERFVPTDGGTIELTDGDRWTYDSLPVDGLNALTRDLGASSRGALDALGHSFGPRIAVWVNVVEYHNATYGRNFLTASAPDIDALDSGRIAGWERTGQSFTAFDRGQGVAVPVCRYYYPTADIGSHFFSASGDECAAVAAQLAGAQLETAAAFYAVLPDTVTGACPHNVTVGIVTYVTTDPVYRVWDPIGGAEHRYTTDRALRDQWVAEGWKAEGYGRDAVAMCGT